MEREANYAAVGAFVVLVVIMAVLFVYWYSDSREHRDYKRYEVYFEGSVSGLERGAQVRYLGVDVGRVYSMRIDPRDSSRVQVLVDVDSTAPVSSKTVAELSLQGVTGLLYIDLLAHGDPKRRMDPVPSEQYPVIDSVQSNFDLFLASLPDVVGRAGDLIDRASKVLSNENIAALSATMKNIEKSSNSLPKTLEDASVVVAELKTAIADVRAAAAGARTLVDTSGPNLAAA